MTLPDSDDDEPPMAPPEVASGGGYPDAGSLLVAHAEQDLSDEGQTMVAPPESNDPESLREHARQLVEEVYERSYDNGTDVVMDAVRSLHPYWHEHELETARGKLVKWVRSSNDWVYGEMESESFTTLAAHLSISESDTFLDLGCGTGKIAALASLYFRRSFGLELQKDLHLLAGELSEMFCRRSQNLGLCTGQMATFRADFLGQLTAPWACPGDGQPWWEVADVVYACSPKFSAATMSALAGLAEKMRPGARFVTVRYALRTPCLEETWRGEGVFSWGRDDMIVHRRKSENTENT
eukprot:TRINITY_DN111927_c0_g1_i1.p1 TRINITY_DN111927_c0_g1~~TRINITY_DN111927_c0_g1_i1.p1  ORF type:complete len:304 (+),score=50.72 TRINITY_DN111927_c0_g1_i1:25-912(+)